MTDNPYASPEANVDRPPITEGRHKVGEARSVPAGRGLEWITGGFRYFSASPLMWIVAIVIWFVVMIVLSIIPLVNLAITLLSPVIIAGFMIGCDAQDQHESFNLNHAFAGFQTNTSQLLVAGALYLAGSLLVGFVAVALMFVFGGAGVLALLAGGEMAGAGLGLLGIALAVLIALALSIPLLMAFYFAAPLIALGNVPAMDAIKMSFVACLRNLLPFLVFGILLFVMAIVAAIPLMLGYLVFFPVMLAAGYASYKDVFVNTDDIALGPA